MAGEKCDKGYICRISIAQARMLSRSARAETRQSRKEDIKRVMHSVDKVTKTIIDFNFQNYLFLKKKQ